MGLKNHYWNQLLKAQKAGDIKAIKHWRNKIAQLRRERQRNRRQQSAGDPSSASTAGAAAAPAAGNPAGAPLTTSPVSVRSPNPTSQLPGPFPILWPRLPDGSPIPDFPDPRFPLPRRPLPDEKPIPDPESPEPLPQAPPRRRRPSGGLKNKYQNELRKAQRRGDQETIEHWQRKLDALKKARGDAAWERAKAKREGVPYVPKTAPRSGGYQVQAGDSWFSIAGKIYGDQRLAGQLMEANRGFKMLHPGDIIKLPKFGAPAPGERVEFSQDAYQQALAINNALREAELREREIDWERKYEQLLSPEDEVALAATVADAIRGAALDFDPLNLDDRRALAGRPEILRPGTQPVVQPSDPFMDKFERFDFDKEVVDLTEEETDFDPTSLEDRRVVAGRPEAVAPGTKPVERPEDPFPEKNERFGLDDEVTVQSLGTSRKPDYMVLPQLQPEEVLEELRKWRDEQLAGIINQGDRQRIEKEYLDLVNQAQQGRADEVLDEIGVKSQTPTIANNLLFDEPHENPIMYPSEIGGFDFHPRSDWGAQEVRPGVLENLFANGFADGYLLYDNTPQIYNTIVIHDTGVAVSQYSGQSNDQIMYNMQAYHMRVPAGKEIDGLGQGKADIGYHFVIMPDGSIYEGRDLRARGAHIDPEYDPVTGNPLAGNTGSIGISLVGDFDMGDDPTDEQLAALRSLLSFLDDNLPNLGCIAGHGDVNDGKELGNDPLLDDLAKEYGWNLSGTACYQTPQN